MALDYNGLAVYRRVANSIEFIDANTPEGQYSVLWFSSKLPGDTMDYQAIAASLRTRLDGISARPPARYAPGTALILVDRDKNFFDAANAAAAQVGMTLQLRKQEMIFAEGPGAADRILVPCFSRQPERLDIHICYSPVYQATSLSARLLAQSVLAGIF